MNYWEMLEAISPYDCCKGRNKTAQGFVWRYAEC